MMRLLSRLIFGATLWVVGVHAQSVSVMRSEGADEKMPRVVLLMDDADLEALVIAGFDGVETLGRAELPKVAVERLLAGGGLELNGADIALVVERTEQRGVVKIVDCATGATVVALELPKMPVAETARWIVARTRPYLGVTADGAGLLISLTGLRFVTDSAENRSAERALNLMLTARLQARGAVVLERWRMGDLVFEKSMHADESPFWRAAQIVDGSVMAAGGRLSARVRIRDAAGAEIFLQAEGGPAGELIDDVVTRVLAGRGAAAAGAGEKMGTEATAFLAEARWMLEHGLPREAWQATESALALGVEPRREAEMLRVKAAAMCAYPDDLRGIKMRDGDYWAHALAPLELAARVAAATEAMLLAGDYWNAHLPGELTERSLEHRATLGVRSLYTGLRVLRSASDLGWAETNADAVRGLREAIRDNIALFRDAPLGEARWVLYMYLANYAGYWAETPTEAVEFYRVILAPDFDAGHSSWRDTVRRELSYRAMPRPPFLVGALPSKDFSSGSGARFVPARKDGSDRIAWEAFLDELERSPDVLRQSDGLALRWQSTADKRARFALTVRIADFVSEHVDALAGPQGLAIFAQLAEPLRDVGRSDELASAQAKVIGMFLSLIRSESAVSPVLIEHIEMIFGTGSANATEDQGRQLLEALDARRSRLTTAGRMISADTRARSSILKRFPSLRPAENAANALTVQSLWIAREHAPADLRMYVGFQHNAAVWEAGRLWVLDHLHSRLWEIDPQSGGTIIHSPENGPETRYKAQLVSWGKRFAITAEEGVWLLNETRTRWEKLDLPPARYQLGVAHGDLWAASGELVRVSVVKHNEGSALYRISPGLRCELVASSRRRPSEHPLDTLLTGAPFSVSPSRGGGVLIGARREVGSFTFFDSASDVLPKEINTRFAGDLRCTSSSGLMMRCRYPDGDRQRPIRMELLDAQADELLLSHPDLRRSQPARFEYPEELKNLPVSKYAAVWRNGGLDVLAWSAFGSPWGASEAWLARIDARGSVVRPLRFAWSAATDQRMRVAGYDAKAFRYPWPDETGLIASDQGLVITGSGMSGFWFIPNEDLDAPRKGMRVMEEK